MIFSLQKRFLVFLLFPVLLILLIAGLASFLYARSFLLDQWNVIARLGLEKTAHQIRMRLDEKREIMELITAAEKARDSSTQSFLIQELRAQKGVLSVDLKAFAGESLPATDKENVKTASGGENSLSNDSGESPGSIHDPGVVPRSNLSPIQLNVNPHEGYLSLETVFSSKDREPSKRLTVRVSLDYMVEHVGGMSQWEGTSACLIASDGTYLAHTDRSRPWPNNLGQSGDVLENQVLKDIRKRDFGTVFGQGTEADVIMGYYRIPTTSWYLILSATRQSVLAPVLRFRYTYLSAVIVIVLSIGFVIRVNTRSVAVSIGEIAEAAEKVEQGDYTVKIDDTRSDEIGRLKSRFNEMVLGLRQRDLIEQIFGRYVDKKIAQELMSKPEALHLGGEEHLVAILMADLRGFTPTAKKLQPDQVIRLLNRFFSRMIPIIEKYRGIIVDFHGDSILVFFNGIEPDIAISAGSAVKCAIEMQHELAWVSEQNLRDGLPGLSMGVGIHVGEVIVGNIGSETRAKYGIVGSAVNETDRIQSFAQGGNIMMSGRTYELLSDQLVVGPKCEACLKGLEGTLDLYEVREIRPTDLSQG
jgi:adenylate cyclase